MLRWWRNDSTTRATDALRSAEVVDSTSIHILWQTLFRKLTSTYTSVYGNSVYNAACLAVINNQTTRNNTSLAVHTHDLATKELHISKFVLYGMWVGLEIAVHREVER